MSVKLHRFDFGSLRDFGSPLVAEALPEIIEEAPPPPPPPIFSEEELAEARISAQKVGFAEGFDAGLVRAAAQLDDKRKAVDETILHLGAQLSSLRADYYSLLHTESQFLSDLVLKISQKVIGVGLDTYGTAAITALVDQCLPAVLSKPRLIIELHPFAFDATIDRIETLIHAHGFEGELQFRTNEEIGIHDAVLDWGSGEASRNTAALWQGIETLLATMPLALSLPQADPNHTPEDAIIPHSTEPTLTT